VNKGSNAIGFVGIRIWRQNKKSEVRLPRKYEHFFFGRVGWRQRQPARNVTPNWTLLFKDDEKDTYPFNRVRINLIQQHKHALSYLF